MTRISAILGLIGVMVLSSTCTAQQLVENGAYFCTAELSGGLYYNQSAKSWQSTTLRPDHKFVVRIRYLETKKEALAEGITETYGYYEISITDSGKSFALPCWSLGGEHVGKMDRYKQIDCSAGVRDYRFNFEYNRFLETYVIGYVEGRDSNDDTPSISGGTCTRIE